MLDEAPAEVLLRFSEPVDAPPQAVRVFDNAGERVDAGDGGHGADRSMLRVPLPDDLADGVYVVAWRAMSADTHPVRGSFTFTVGEARADVAAAVLADEGQPGWDAAAAAARWITYAGTLLAVGGLVFLVFAHDRTHGERDRLVRLVALAAIAGTAGTVAGISLQAVLATGLGAGALAPEMLAGMLASGYGVSALVRVGGLTALLLAAARLWDGWAVVVGPAAGMATLASFLLTGHTLTAEPRALVWAANLTHTAAAAVWFGGLVMLAVVLHARAGHAAGAVSGARVVARFSVLAVGSMVVVAAAGAALGWAEVRTLRGLTTTAYGWTLLAKAALVAAVVAVGGYNYRRLVPAVRRGAEDAWGRLRRTVRLEVAGMLGVLAVTAALVSVVPARVEAGAGAPYVGYHALGAEYEVNLVVDPARPGTNEIHLYLLDDAGRVADIGEEVELRFSLPDADIDALTREPLPAGPGHYLHVGPELSIAGVWQVEVRVLVSDFQSLTASAEVPVGVAAPAARR